MKILKFFNPDDFFIVNNIEIKKNYDNQEVLVIRATQNKLMDIIAFLTKRNAVQDFRLLYYDDTQSILVIPKYSYCVCIDK